MCRLICSSFFQTLNSKLKKKKKRNRHRPLCWAHITSISTHLFSCKLKTPLKSHKPRAAPSQHEQPFFPCLHHSASGMLGIPHHSYNVRVLIKLRCEQALLTWHVCLTSFPFHRGLHAFSQRSEWYKTADGGDRGKEKDTVWQGRELQSLHLPVSGVSDTEMASGKAPNSTCHCL